MILVMRSIKTSMPYANRFDIQDNLFLREAIPLKRDPFFCGRAEDLARIAKELIFHDERHAGARIVILVGEAGIGKTSLALEFCYRYRLFWPEIYWSYQGDGLWSDAASLKSSCKSHRKPSPESETDTGENALQGEDTYDHPPHLLVIDNLSHIEYLAYWLARFKGMCVLVTSRERDWPGELDPYIQVLDRLNLTDSLRMVQSYAGWEDSYQMELVDLVSLLNRHPGLLRLAGLTLARNGGGDLRSYAAALDNGGYPSSKNVPDEKKKAPAVWQVPLQWLVYDKYWESLADQDDITLYKRVLAGCGYCAPLAPLPLPILSAGLGMDQSSCVEALQALLSLGFLADGQEGPYILESMGEYARDTDLLEGWNTLERMAAEWDLWLSQNKSDRPGPCSVSESAHIHHLAQICERNLMSGIGSLWYSLAHFTEERGDYLLAENYYLHALNNDMATFGGESLRAGIVYYHLGSVSQLQYNTEKAMTYYESALSIFQKLLNPADPLIVYTASKIEYLSQIS